MKKRRPKKKKVKKVVDFDNMPEYVRKLMVITYLEDIHPESVDLFEDCKAFVVEQEIGKYGK